MKLGLLLVPKQHAGPNGSLMVGQTSWGHTVLGFFFLLLLHVFTERPGRDSEFDFFWGFS